MYIETVPFRGDTRGMSALHLRLQLPHDNCVNSHIWRKDGARYNEPRLSVFLSGFLILSVLSVLARLNHTGGEERSVGPSVHWKRPLKRANIPLGRPMQTSIHRGNSISASCRKPQVICARPASSHPLDATRLRFPLRLCRAMPCTPHSPLLRSRVEALVTALSRLGNQGNHCSTCLPETYRGYSLVTRERDGNRPGEWTDVAINQVCSNPEPCPRQVMPGWSEREAIRSNDVPGPLKSISFSSASPRSPPSLPCARLLRVIVDGSEKRTCVPDITFGLRFWLLPFEEKLIPLRIVSIDNTKTFRERPWELDVFCNNRRKKILRLRDYSFSFSLTQKRS